MNKLKVKKEGRENMYIPEKDSLKKFIEGRKLKQIHNFIPSGALILGADHNIESVMKDIDQANRLAIFTDPNANMGHSLALIFGDHKKGDVEKLECYDIGKIIEKDLEIK